MTDVRVVWGWLSGPHGQRLGQLLIVVTGLAVLIVGARAERIEACNQAYNEATSQVSAERARVADQRAEALYEAMRASLSGNAGEYRREAQEFLTAYEEERRVRQQTPLVEPPRDFCG